MKKLLLVPIAALIFAVGAIAPAEAGKLPLPGVGVEDVCACGGTVYVVWTMIYWPNGPTNAAWCVRQWSNGVQTNTFC